MPFYLEPMSPHHTARLARQADTVPAHYRALDDEGPVTSGGVDHAAIDSALAVARPVYDWGAGNRRKKDAVAQPRAALRST